MALILRPGRWRTPPTYAVKLDETHALVDGCRLIDFVSPITNGSARLRAGWTTNDNTNMAIGRIYGGRAFRPGLVSSIANGNFTVPIRPAVIGFSDYSLAFEASHNSGDSALAFAFLSGGSGTTILSFRAGQGTSYWSGAFDFPNTGGWGNELKGGLAAVIQRSGGTDYTAFGRTGAGETSPTAGNQDLGTHTAVVIGRHPLGSANYVNTRVGFVAIWGKALGRGAAQDFLENPWQIFEPDLARTFHFFTAGAETRTATLSQTIEAVSVSASATVALTATSSIVLEGAQLSASAAVALVASANVTLDGATLEAAAAGIKTGTVDVTLDEATLEAFATVSISASVSVLLDGVTLQAEGGAANFAQVDTQLADVTLATSGVVATSASATATLDGASAAASGIVLVTGSAAVLLGADIVVADGAVLVQAALARTLDGVTLAATATASSPSEGTLDVTLDDVTLAMFASSNIVRTILTSDALVNTATASDALVNRATSSDSL